MMQRWVINFLEVRIWSFSDSRDKLAQARTL